MKLLDPIRWICSWKCRIDFRGTVGLVLWRGVPVFPLFTIDEIKLCLFQEWPEW